MPICRCVLTAIYLADRGGKHSAKMHAALAQDQSNGTWSGKDWKLHFGEEKRILIPNMRKGANELRRRSMSFGRGSEKYRQLNADANTLERNADRILREHVVLEAQLDKDGTMNLTLLRSHSAMEDDSVEILNRYKL